jgi:spore coat protein U-like protein
MKLISTLVAASIAALTILPAQAATVGPVGFNVTASLTSQCLVSTVANVAFTYTSFQAAAATATGGGFTVQCTNTQGYTIALSATSGTVPTVNLAYTLALSAASGTGNGLAQAFNVTGSMASGQAGTCATSGTACSGTSAQTLTVSY